MIKPASLSVAAGLVVGALAWFDPLFIPLVLAGPIVSGTVAGLRRIPLRWVACAWAVAGISMIASDWILNHEDRLFHTVLSFVMVGLASAAWCVGSRVERKRATRVAPGI